MSELDRAREHLQDLQNLQKNYGKRIVFGLNLDGVRPVPRWRLPSQWQGPEFQWLRVCRGRPGVICQECLHTP